MIPHPSREEIRITLSILSNLLLYSFLFYNTLSVRDSAKQGEIINLKDFKVSNSLCYLSFATINIIIIEFEEK